MIIADTGFWVALASGKDRHHARARAWLEVLDEALVSTWPVVTETCHLLLHRLEIESQEKYMRSYSDGAFEVFDLDRQHVPQIADLMHRYAQLPMDLADASLVILAEDLGHGRILSTDQRDFNAYRWKQRHPFRNLLLEDPETYR